MFTRIETRTFIQNNLPRFREKTLNVLNNGRIKVASSLNKFQSGLLRYTNLFKLRSDNISTEFNRTLNQITGYEECEKLRNVVKASDEHFRRVREELRQSRSDFDKAIQSRSQCQKELNALLQRKQTWLDEDLMRFTELYRKEMRLEQAESEAKMTNERLEQEVDQAHGSLMNALRERYQEEQLWSDKIRRLSTFGTFSLMALNLLLFLVIQLYIEPRKRRGYITNFEDVMAARFSLLQSNLEKIIDTPDVTSNPKPIPTIGFQSHKVSTFLQQNWAGLATGAATGTTILLLIQCLGHLITS